MPGLLAAEESALTAKRLEHVAIADVRHDHGDPALRHQPVEAEIRHHRDGHLVDAERERQHGHDLVAVHGLTVLVHGHMRSPSPSNAIPRS